MLRLTLAAVLCALTLGGCLQKSEFQASIQILDEETGRPIPDAWVLPTAHVITEPPVDRFDVLAAERGRTGADGVARFTRVLGLYRPDAPQDPLWKAVDAKQAALRKPGHIAGGSIVVLAAGYGLVHQPFAVEDSPVFQGWLKDNPGRAEDYGGPLGRHAVKTNLKALLLKSAGFKDGVRLTLRLRKPTSARELAETESFRLSRAMWGTWHALSRQTGATEREQRAIYEFCAAQMKAVADETRDPWHREMYEAYFNAEARRKYISENHGLGPDAQNGLIQAWLTQKALEILPQEAEEVKLYANEVLLGVLEEGRSPAWQNHFLDPKEPANGLPGSESALRWAGLDGDNPNNPWDWQDAQRYYREGDRRKAYLALGHVVRLLGNLAIPKYTVPDPAKETAFEIAVLNVMGDNLGQLPPEYWHSAKDPAFARTPKERFEALARRTADSGASALEARGPGTGTLSPDMTDVAGSDSDLMAAKASFPNTIAQAAGLLRDFHRFMHPPAYVQAPGNGNGGPQAVRQSSATDAGGAKDATTSSGINQRGTSDAGPSSSQVGNGEFLLQRQPQSAPTGAVEHCLLRSDAEGKPLPRVLIKKDRIEIIGDDGRLKSIWPRSNDASEKIETRIYPDKHGKVIGVHVTKGYGERREGWTSGEYYILDASGNKTLDLKKFDANTMPIPSPSGDYAVGWPGADTPGGPPIFYDAKGVRNKWAHGFTGDGWPEGYATNGVSFSPDGHSAAVLAEGIGRDKHLMIVYDAYGEKILEKDGVSRDVVFSPDGSQIAYYSMPRGHIGLVDTNGHVLWIRNLQALPRLFSSDGHHLLVMTGNFVGMLQANTGNLVWKWEANAENLRGRSTPRTPDMGEGFALRSLAATPDFSRVVMTATTLRRESVKPAGWRLVSASDHILVFNENGRLIHWESLPGDSLQIPSTLLQVSQDGKTIVTSTNDGISHFSMKHK